jgi:hypothetical protein
MADQRFERWRARFSQSGDICPVHLGMSRDELRATLGEPDSLGATSRRQRTPLIWLYEDIEFHFDGSAPGVLFLIYSDDADGFVKLSISALGTPRTQP